MCGHPGDGGTCEHRQTSRDQDGLPLLALSPGAGTYLALVPGVGWREGLQPTNTPRYVYVRGLALTQGGQVQLEENSFFIQVVVLSDGKYALPTKVSMYYPNSLPPTPLSN